MSSQSSSEVRPIKNEVLTFKSAKAIFPKIYPLIFNLCTVYFLEYCAITCFSDRISIQVRREMSIEDQSFQVRQYYVILANCYQVGVFVSRSSLQYYPVKRVSVLTMLQFMNFSFLFMNTIFLICPSLYVMCPLYVFIGLMGGASYVNVMHQILESEQLRQSQKEAALVLTLIFNDIGVLLAAIFSLIMSQTVIE